MPRCTVLVMVIALCRVLNPASNRQVAARPVQRMTRLICCCCQHIAQPQKFAHTDAVPASTIQLVAAHTRLTSTDAGAETLPSLHSDPLHVSRQAGRQQVTCIQPFHSSVCCRLSRTGALPFFREVAKATSVRPRKMKPITSLL